MKLDLMKDHTLAGKLVIHLEDKSAIKSVEDFYKSNAPCLNCLTQSMCLRIKTLEITVTPCKEIMEFLDDGNALVYYP